jgi:DNA-binding MarR family transcriptional regulator
VKPVPTKPSQREYETVASLRSALRRFLQAGEAVTRSHGLTPQRYDLLAIVKGGNDAPSVSEIAERLALARHSATELVERAEQAGLVRRVADEHDGRVTRVALTAEGEKRLDAALIDLREERRRLFELLGSFSSD